MNVLSLKFANVVIVAVLLISPFVVGLTASQYDPWADINEDGKIDIYDVAYTARAFGASGDPAKNVTIAGYATVNEETGVGPLPEETEWVFIDTRGYREITVGFNPLGNPPLNILIRWYVGGSYWDWESFTIGDDEIRVYDIHGIQLGIAITNQDTVPCDVIISYYITA